MISTIVPVYNAGNYLSPLIQSVLAQSCSDLELLLIDDGSTDGSGIICDQWAQKDSRVRVFHKENGGQSSARNLGLDVAKGDVIAFADHDDVLHPLMYETLLKMLINSHTHVSACQFANTPTAGIDTLDFSLPIDASVCVSQQELVHRYFTPAWHIPVWNKLYRREVIDGLRFHGARLGEDNLFSYQVLKRCKQLAFCPSTLYFQRMHSNNFEFTGIRYMVDLITAKETILKDIHTYFPHEYRYAQASFLSESVRIYNLYEKCSPEYEDQKQQVYRLLRKNTNGIWLTNLPFGQKLRFWQLRLLGKKTHTGPIYI